MVITLIYFNINIDHFYFLILLKLHFYTVTSFSYTSFNKIFFFFSKIIENKTKQKKRQSSNTDDYPKGIHLFNGSTKLLNHVINEPIDTIKRKRHHEVTSNQTILHRASEAAVTPEWILNKDAVQGWAKISKGKIMELKKNNDGSYDIINDEF